MGNASISDDPYARDKQTGARDFPRGARGKIINLPPAGGSPFIFRRPLRHSGGETSGSFFETRVSFSRGGAWIDLGSTAALEVGGEGRTFWEEPAVKSQICRERLIILLRPRAQG